MITTRFMEAASHDRADRPAVATGHGPPLDAEDQARLTTGFRGQPTWRTPPMRYARLATDGQATVYVLDELSGIAFIVA